jgi:starch synthase
VDAITSSQDELVWPETAGSRPSRLHVTMVASEVAPFAKTGGLADVTGSLPEALERLGHRVTTIMPRYRGLSVGDAVPRTRLVRLGSLEEEVTWHVRPVSDTRRVVFVDIPRLFDRAGYYGEGGQDYADSGERFGLLAAAALEFIEFDSDAPPVDVIHAHDWQAGLVPTLVRTDPRHYAALGHTALVFTIHNLAYQGLCPQDIVPALGLPWSAFTMETGEFWGQFSFLKAGITYSDMVTTVSPAYARETQRRQFGAGLEGVLAARADRYSGILNGIDTNVWNPATDPFLPAHFDVGSLSGKAACKRALLARFQLPVGDDALGRPVVGLVSRLVDQKGLDLIERASDDLIELDATWIFVGTGDARYEQFLRELAVRFPSRVGVFIGFDEGLAHLVEAGADLFLMPSTFEPCGLNQMYSLRYGTVPVVHAVGGLDDTIQPYAPRARHANGFKFRDASPANLVRVMRQALRVYHDKAAWGPLMEAGMRDDHSWQTSAREYVKVYRRARQAAAQRAGA